MFKMYSQERAIKLMFVIYMQGVNPWLKKGQLNGIICKGYENGVSAVLSFARHTLSHLEEVEFSLAFIALDYAYLADLQLQF